MNLTAKESPGFPRSWYEVPMVRLVIPFTLGILISNYFTWPYSLSIVLSLVTIVGLALLSHLSIPHKWRYGVGVFLIFGMMLLGFTSVQLLDTPTQSSVFQSIKDKDVYFFGIVEDLPSLGTTTYRTKFRVLGVLDSAGKKIEQSCNNVIMLTLQADSVSRQLRYGHELILKSRISATQASLNPNAFDYKLYLQRKQIYYQAYSKSGLFIMTGKRLWSVTSLAKDIQLQCVEIYRKFLSDADDVFSVSTALVFGYRSDVSEEVIRDFAATGAMHVLSVSGLHMGMLSMMLVFILGYILPQKRHTRHRGAVVFVAIWLFTFISGCSAAVLRSAVMFTLLMVSKVVEGRKNTYNVLAASAFLLLVYDPFLIYDVGFQLSYMALLGIMLWQKPIYATIIVPTWLGDKIWNLTSVSVAAQLGTLPLGLLYFNQFPTYFWLSGLLVVPISFVAMMSGVALLVLYWLPGVNWLIAQTLYWSVWLMNKSLAVMHQFPLATLNGFSLAVYEVVLFYLLLWFASVFCFRYDKKSLYISLSLLVVLGTSRLYRHIEQVDQHRFIVYTHKNHSYLHYISGKNSMLVSDSLRLNSKFEYNVLNPNLAFYGLNKPLNNGNKNYSNFIVLPHWTIFRTNANQNYKAISLPVKVNMLWVQNPPYRFDLEEMLLNLKPQKVLLDFNNSRWRNAKFEQICKKLNIQYFNQSNQGAYVHEL
jgi:competence protein ComEC